MKRLVVFFSILLSLCLTANVFAAAYTATFVISETASASYTMLPMLKDAPITWLSSNGYITSTGLDTRIETLAGLEKPHVLATDKILTAVAVPADSQTNLNFTTGNSALTSMNIIAGYNGYYTIPDAAALELGNNFEIDLDAYVDTSAGADKNLVYKLGAFKLYISAANTITADITTDIKEETQTGADPLYLGSNVKVGTRIDNLPAITIYQVDMYLSKVGAPVGNATVELRDVAADGLIGTFGTIDVTTIGLAGAWFSFTTPVANPALQNVRVVVSYAGGDAGNYIIEGRRDAATIAGSQRTYFNAGVWTDDVLREAVCRVFYVGATVSDAITTGEHVIKVTATGGGTNLLSIQVDSAAAVTSALAGASVPDNANTWYLSQNNVTPYMSYYKHTVGGVLIAWYQPITIITNTYVDGTADAGGDANTIIDAVLTQADDYWNFALVTITDTTDNLAPIGETAVVLDFAAGTDEITLATNLTAGVDAGDTYTVEFGTLVDRQGAAQDARITWGVNPTGISIALGSLTSISQPSAGQTIDSPDIDILPPVSTSDWYEEPDVTGALLTNPLRPFVTIMSDSTSLTEMQAWRLLGLAFVLFFTVVAAVAVKSHLLIAGIVCGSCIGLMVAFTIFPLWSVVFIIGAIAAGVIAERSPSL